MIYRDGIEVPFEAGHRLLAYAGKCAVPHGHSFRAEFVVEGEALNELGLLVDFGDLKRELRDWVEQNWDHGFLVNSRDEELLAAFKAIHNAKVYVFPGRNPSAEEMARELYCLTASRFPALRVRVRVWESTKQFAECSAGGDA